MKSLRLKILAASLLALLELAGCGYHAVTARGPLAQGNGVNVTLFANRSYRPGLEGVLALSLVDELARRTGGRVLSREEAQLELGGVVKTYTTNAVSYTASDIIREYRSVVTVQAVLQEKESRKVLWKGELAEAQTFPASTNIALQQDAEAAATEKICRRLSEDIWRRISEAF